MPAQELNRGLQLIGKRRRGQGGKERLGLHLPVRHALFKLCPDATYDLAELHVRALHARRVAHVLQR
eukprot:13647769-Alexandrium_andersonii.AAC.1